MKRIDCLLPVRLGLLLGIAAAWMTPAEATPPTLSVTVAPNTLANRDVAFGSGTLRRAGTRSQQVYGVTHFPQTGLLITELRFRPDYFYGRAFSATITNLQVKLSTTTRNPDSLSATFAGNVGTDETEVFSGALAVASAFQGPATGPKAFDIVIPLTTPFVFNPAAGNLLLDIRNFASTTNISHLSGEGVLGDSASRVVGGIGGATGTTDTGVDALQLVYFATNAPPMPPPRTRLVRGPYLQSGTTSNLVVCWRTDLLTNSRVRFGLSPHSLEWAVTTTALVTDHRVSLTNLAPDTRYFYSIGAGETNLAGGAEHFFVTVPASARPTRIWVIGDSGTANLVRVPWATYGPLEVRDAYYAHAGSRHTDVWLMLGDNAYGNGLDHEYQTNVFEVYQDLLRKTVLWSTIGNHDVPGPYFDIFTFPRNGEAGGVASGTEAYYSFNHGNIHFVCIDAEVSSRQPGSPMLTWLEQDLAANTKDWIIAFWHEPPYSFGSHNSDDFGDSGGKLVEMRQNVVPILESYGVDLVLAGHSHNYERSLLIDGHYGLSSTFAPTMARDAGSGRPHDTGAYIKSGAGASPRQGAVYVVCGSSGWVTPGYPTIPPGLYLRHPAMFTGLARLGSLVLDIAGNRLDAKFLRDNGAVDDHFTILKGVPPESLRLATVRIQDGQVMAQFKSVAGRRYRVEKTRQLDPAQWEPAGGMITATGATTRWAGPASESEGCYFRVAAVE